ARRNRCAIEIIRLEDLLMPIRAVVIVMTRLLIAFVLRRTFVFPVVLTVLLLALSFTLWLGAFTLLLTLTRRRRGLRCRRRGCLRRRRFFSRFFLLLDLIQAQTRTVKLRRMNPSGDAIQHIHHSFMAGFCIVECVIS